MVLSLDPFLAVREFEGVSHQSGLDLELYVDRPNDQQKTLQISNQ